MALRSNYVLGFAVDEGGQEREEGPRALAETAAKPIVGSSGRHPDAQAARTSRKKSKIEKVSSCALSSNEYCMPPWSLR